MRIYFERSGGFLGTRLTGTVDTDLLPDEEALELKEMIETAGFFELPQAMAPEMEGADQFQYKMVVEDEEREHSVEISDAAAPDELRPLLRRLTILARSGTGSPPASSE